MIKGIINGYYRTGTTAIFQVLQESNPYPILYEPHSPGVHSDFRTLNPSPDFVNGLHGVKLYRGYFSIPDSVREEFLRKAKPKSMYKKNEIDLAIETVEMFHDLDQPVYLQTNQLHLIIEDVAEYFGCRYVHVVRDPVEVLYSHAGRPERIRAKLDRILVSLLPNMAIAKFVDQGRFELKETMRVARELGWLKGGDMLEKFLRMYIHYNYHVVENMSKGELVVFDHFVKFGDYTGAFRNLGLSTERREFLSPRRAFQAPKILRRAVLRRLDSEMKRMLFEMGVIV